MLKAGPRRAMTQSPLNPEPDPPASVGPGPDHRQAVQKLFIRNASVIRGFILSLLPVRELVDDVFHDVFLVVIDKADSFEPGSDFLAWVYVISRHKVLQAMTKLRGKRTNVLAPEVMEALIADAPTEAFSEDTVDALKACVDSLAPAARRMIQLRYEEALKPAQIAEKLNIGTNSIYVTLSRARSLLRRCIKQRLASAR
ncbi:MAG: sigma-70 family RNA polymerase sigma factor [Phycisphaeraceae bacterium]